MKKCWLDKKNIVITGASSGLGYMLSKMLILKHGCHVIGIGRSEDKFKKIAEELGENFEYRLFDVSIEDNWKNFAIECEDKNIDILINNAGVLPPFASFKNMIIKDNNIDLESAKSTMNINLMSVIYGSSYMMNIIEKSSTPAIINVASSAGLCALPGTAVYSASKAGIKNFTESLMCEKDYYIGLVCPGFTKTNIFRHQTKNMDSKLINFIATPLDKMANKIYKGIKKKKRRMVLGIDAKFMDKMYRHFPKASLKLITKIMKSARIELFEDIFNE